MCSYVKYIFPAAVYNIELIVHKIEQVHRPTYCDNRALNDITFHATRASGVRFGHTLRRIRPTRIRHAKFKAFSTL